MIVECYVNDQLGTDYPVSLWLGYPSAGEPTWARFSKDFCFRSYDASTEGDA